VSENNDEYGTGYAFLIIFVILMILTLLISLSPTS